MKRKVLWTVVIDILILVVIIGVSRYIEVRTRQTDPNWQIANEIYKVENALKEVDEDYECQSVSKVTPFTYTDSEGNTIVYYCCQTAYVSNESEEYAGLNMDAIGLVIDVSQIENRKECTVNQYDAFLCEIKDQSYLCWTPSSEITCVIECCSDATSEAGIFKMTESFCCLLIDANSESPISTVFLQLSIIFYILKTKISCQSKRGCYIQIASS